MADKSSDPGITALGSHLYVYWHIPAIIPLTFSNDSPGYRGPADLVFSIQEKLALFGLEELNSFSAKHSPHMVCFAVYRSSLPREGRAGGSDG